jgi:hypothetical protein
MKGSWSLDHGPSVFLQEEVMKRITIREDALQAVEYKAIFPFQQQMMAAEADIHGKKVRLFYVDIDEEVENHIRSKGVNINDIDQVSDFILSATTLQH